MALLAAAEVFQVAFVMAVLAVEEFCNDMLAVAMLGLGCCAADRAMVVLSKAMLFFQI